MLRAVLFTTLFICAAVYAIDPHSSSTTHIPSKTRTVASSEERGPGDKPRNPRSQLRDDLLASYDKTTRPVLDLKKTTDVQVGVTFNTFDVNWDGRLESNIFMIMAWEDENLKWNPSKYDGVEYLMVPADEIWIPDVFIYNYYGEPQIQKSDRLLALVYHNGSALVVPPMTLETQCKLDFSNWPYDTQNCSIMAGPWVYDNSELATYVSSWALTEKDAGQGKWEVIGQHARRESKEYECCPGKKYDNVQFSIQFKRTAQFDQGLATIPLVVVYLLGLSSFLLPVGSNQRYIFNGIAILVSLFTVQSIRESIGISGQGFPKIALLHLINILAIAIAQVISVIILGSSRSSSGARLAALLSKVVNKNNDDDIDKLIAKEKLKEIDDSKQNVSTMVTVADRFFLAAYTVATVAVVTIFSPYQ